MNARSRVPLIAGLLTLLGAVAASRVLGDRTPAFVQGLLYGLGVAALVVGLLRAYLPTPCDTATPRLRRRYLREFLPAMALYIAAVLASAWLLRRVDDTVLRALVALLPVPGVALALRAVVRYIRDADELQRRIEVEALAIGTAAVSLGYLAAGLLQAAKVIALPAGAAMIWVLPLVCLAYGAAKIVVSRRYA